MVRLFGKYCFVQALFLFPMTLHLLSDALEISSLRPANNAGAGAWIFFSLVVLVMLTSGWFGLRTIRR